MSKYREAMLLMAQGSTKEEAAQAAGIPTSQLEVVASSPLFMAEFESMKQQVETCLLR